MNLKMSGGCQCGRVRYEAVVEDDGAYLCHCRMCKRATGGFAAAFVELPVAALAWRGEPDWYRSSPIARRAFCSTCGTPIGFDFVDSTGRMDLTLGSFDDPAYFRPVGHGGAESLIEAWLDTSALPRQRSDGTDSVVAHWTAAGLEVPE